MTNKLDIDNLKLNNSSLMKFKKAELVSIAEQFDLTNVKSLTKQEITTKIIETAKDKDSLFKDSSKNMKSTKMPAKKTSQKSNTINNKIDKTKNINVITEINTNEPDIVDDVYVSSTRDQKDLPYEYNEDKATLLVRDPKCIFAFWEITSTLIQKYSIGYDRQLIMRIIDVTDSNNPYEYSWYKDYDIGEAQNWYIHVENSNRDYQALFGYHDSERFVPILISNRVMVPRDSVSDDIDEQWMNPNDQWQQIFEFSGATAGQIPLEITTGSSMELVSRRMEFKMPDSWAFSEGLQKKSNNKVKV